jgi:hypothetical protein
MGSVRHQSRESRPAVILVDSQMDGADERTNVTFSSRPPAGIVTNRVPGLEFVTLSG